MDWVGFTFVMALVGGPLIVLVIGACRIAAAIRRGVMERKCETCEFWLRYTTHTGECRRMSPSRMENATNAHSAVIPVWPHTPENSWCGEWKERGTAQEPGDS